MLHNQFLKLVYNQIFIIDYYLYLKQNGCNSWEFCWFSKPETNLLFSEVLLDTSKFTTELSQKGWIFPNNSKVYLIFWNNILGSGSWGRRLEFFRTGSLVQFSISRRDNNKLRMHNAKTEKRKLAWNNLYFKWIIAGP